MRLMALEPLKLQHLHALQSFLDGKYGGDFVQGHLAVFLLSNHHHLSDKPILALR